MSNVVDLPQPELGYWTCDCGCSTHRVRSDGEIECASCGVRGDGVGYWRLPKLSEPQEAAANQAEPFDTKDVDLDFSRRRFAQRVEAGEFIVLIGLKEDGGISTQHDNAKVETTAQAAWLRRRFREAYRMVRGLPGRKS